MKKLNSIYTLVFFLLLNSAEAWARAGGGGGRRSSSSSHSSSHSSHSYGSSGGGGSFSWGYIILVLVVLAVIYIVVKKYKGPGAGMLSSITGIDTDTDEEEGLEIQSNDGAPVITEAFLLANPGFSNDGFQDKVRTAFMAIQQAWQDQNLGKVRKWISDGVYQRFSIQFDMMKKLGQKNLLSNIDIEQVQFVKAYTESNYSVVTVGVRFTMDDKFISEKMPQLNESYSGDQAIEYWTFVKKSGAVNKDLYQSNSCPNCGNGLNEDGGEVSKCPSCGTVTYLGDYDWVLSEITQSEDYAADSWYNPDNISLAPLRKEEEFCMQNMEDKASNAFVHYLFASAWNKADHCNRFASDEVIAEINAEKDEPYVFNRIYVNRVSFAAYAPGENMHQLHFTIVYSGQKVKLEENKVKKLDDDMVTRMASLTLSRKAGAVSKSKLWSHDCPGCGAPYTDSTSMKCAYCGSKINSADNDWIVTKLITA
ncbi:MAG: TIM44-like domain-containing protein [Bacteroidia bacterium]